MADPRVKVDAEGGVDVFLTIGDRLPVEQVYADREEARKEALWRTLVGPVSIDASEEGLAASAAGAAQMPDERKITGQAPALDPAAQGLSEGFARLFGFKNASEAQQKLAAGEFGVSDLLKIMDPAGNITEATIRDRGAEVGLPPETVETLAAAGGLLAGILFPPSAAQKAAATAGRGVKALTRSGGKDFLRVAKKGFAQERYPFTQKVRVTWEDGLVHEDEIKGLNKGHAIARAKSNWPDAISVEPIDEFTDARGALFPPNAAQKAAAVGGRVLKGKVFHGTTKAFEQFDVAKADPAGLFGPGLYFTENPRVAGGYSKAEEAREGANIRPSYLDIQRPLDIEGTYRASDLLPSPNKPLPWEGDPKAWRDVMEEDILPAARGHNRDNPAVAVAGDSFYRALVDYFNGDKAKVQLALQHLGFDGITHTGGKITGGEPHKVWIAFKPEQVKDAATVDFAAQKGISVEEAESALERLRRFLAGERGSIDPEAFLGGERQAGRQAGAAGAGGAPTGGPQAGGAGAGTATGAGGAPPGGMPPAGESRINLERVQATASVKRTMARINAMQAERLAESRATVSHEATIAAGRRFTLEDALAAMPEELDDARALQQAVRDYHNAVATRLDELAPMAADGIPSAVNEVADLWVIAGELSAKDEMLGRGAARMLEARKILSEADRAPFTIGDIAAVRDRIGLEGVDGQVIGRMLLTLPKSQREAFARATVEAARSGQNLFYTIWINFLLSGPQTHAVNFLSNTATALWAIPERALAARLHVGADPGVFRGEAAAMLRGLTEGFRDGIRAAGHALRTGQEAVAPGARKVEIGYGLAPKEGPTRAVDYLAMLVPTRWLVSSDAFFKTINYRMEVKAQALRQAMLEGLEGKAAARRMLEIERAPEKFPEIHRAAEAFALMNTFQKEMTGLSGRVGEIGMKVANLPMGRLVLPFVRTPTNLAQYAAQRTPVLNLLSETLRRDIRAGGAARDLALAKVATSAMVGATVMTLAGAGMISGGGPKDRNLQRVMRDSGWQPYSIRVGDTWYAYSRTDPFGMMLGIVADAAQVMGELPEADALDLAGAISLAMVRNMTSKTYLTGLADFLDAIENPDARGRRFLESLSRTVVPTGVRQVTRTIDPELKEARGMVDQILAGIPGFSATLPPRRNLWGDPIVLGGGWGPDLISPIYTSEIKDDPVSAEIIRNRVSLSMPSRWFDGPPERRGIQLEAPTRTPGLELTPEEYDRYVVLVGKGTPGEPTLKEALAAEMAEGAPYWNETDGPEGGKALIIRAIVEAYKKQAKGQLFEEFPALRQAWEQHVERRGQRFDPAVNPPARRGPMPSFNLTR